MLHLKLVILSASRGRFICLNELILIPCAQINMLHQYYNEMNPSNGQYSVLIGFKDTFITGGNNLLLFRPQAITANDNNLPLYSEFTHRDIFQEFQIQDRFQTVSECSDMSESRKSFSLIQSHYEYLRL